MTTPRTASTTDARKRLAENAAAPELTAEAGNPILSDALTYYAERRSMANPKDWDHVLRVVEAAIRRGVYGTATRGQVTQARAVLSTLSAAAIEARP